MARMINHEVVKHWLAGQAAENHKGTLRSDGDRLYSYNLIIGDTDHDFGLKVVRDYTAPGNHRYHSQTTSCHVGMARMRADLVD